MYYLRNPLSKSLTRNKSTYISPNFDVEKGIVCTVKYSMFHGSDCETAVCPTVTTRRKCNCKC